MGGMAAHPDQATTPRSTSGALAKVREDKQREASDGHDGTWVAHPDLVPVAQEVFDARARRAPEPDRAAARRRVASTPATCSTCDPDGDVTEEGLRHNVGVGLQYLEAWLRGVGAACRSTT